MKLALKTLIFSLTVIIMSSYSLAQTGNILLFEEPNCRNHLASIEVRANGEITNVRNGDYRRSLYGGNDTISSVFFDRVPVGTVLELWDDGNQRSADDWCRITVMLDGRFRLNHLEFAPNLRGLKYERFGKHDSPTNLGNLKGKVSRLVIIPGKESRTVTNSATSLPQGNPSTATGRTIPEDIDEKWLGTYRLYNAQNDWHIGTISRGQGHSLIWKNQAGVSWRLSFDGRHKVMETSKENPYYNYDGGSMRTFKLRMANDGKPLGFEFGSMFYYKDRKAAKPSTPAIKVNPYALPTKWLGRYELRPVQNDWHVGRITGGYGNSFKWTNRAGVSWKLKLNSHRQIMETGSDNPYHDHSYGGDEIRGFKLKVGPNGQPIGFQFGPMNFYRVGD